MLLQIGENIRRLRLENGDTQEQLANALDTSCQSVSRWELGICYPDLEMLPAIANYFHVTLDSLVGMRSIRSEETRRAIFTAALDSEKSGNWSDAIAILQKALRTHPYDFELSAELALALSQTSHQKDLLDAISISERILDRCTDEKLISTVRANLCFLYKATGQSEKAVALGRSLPHIWECREMLLPSLVPDHERDEITKQSVNVAAQVLSDVSARRPIPFSLGYRYQPNFNHTIDGSS